MSADERLTAALSYGAVGCPSQRLLIVDAEAVPADVLDALAGVGLVVSIAGQQGDVSVDAVDVRPLACVGDQLIVDSLATRIVIEVAP